MPTLMDEVLLLNIQRATKEALVQYQHAQRVKGVARTGYYKLAILLLASAVEATLFDIIKCSLASDPTLAKKQQTKKLKKKHVLPASSLSMTEDMYVCNEIVEDYRLDQKALLDSLNKFAKKAEIINSKLYARIDRVRIKRNQQHLQGLPTSSMSYTRRSMEATARALNTLLEIRKTV